MVAAKKIDHRAQHCRYETLVDLLQIRITVSDCSYRSGARRWRRWFIRYVIIGIGLDGSRVQTLSTTDRIFK